eukprot:gene10545-biopygen13072
MRSFDEKGGKYIGNNGDVNAQTDYWGVIERNDEIRKELEMCIFTAKARENRLRWFGHLNRGDYGKLAKDIMSKEVNGKQGRGKPRTRWKDNIKRDICRN